MAEHSRDEIFFRYSATFRVHGETLPFEEISAQLVLVPSHMHRKGEKRSASHAGFADDAWHYCPPLGRERHLSEHLDALWAALQPHRDYIMELKAKHKVDVFCGYRSNCDHAGVEIPFKSLALFQSLEMPFGLSIAIT